jgi:hypothetical protein
LLILFDCITVRREQGGRNEGGDKNQERKEGGQERGSNKKKRRNIPEEG